MQINKKNIEKYTFQLFIVGNSILNNAAIKNCTVILKKKLKGNYTLEVIDLSNNPTLAIQENIILTPTLKLKNLTSEIRMAGDFSNQQHFLKHFFLQ